MASSPKETIYGPFDNSAWVNIPVTIAACRRMVVVEVPNATNNVQNSNAPQGLQYQRWDPSLPGATDPALLGNWGPTNQALPDEEIPVGDGMSVIGWNAQKTVSDGGVSAFGGGAAGGVQTRAADIPIRVRSATATTTQVRAREWNRGIAITS